MHDHRGNAELLVSLVVKLENHYVRLAAVDAGMLTEILGESIASFVQDLLATLGADGLEAILRSLA
jgi:hypothetical protein